MSLPFLDRPFSGRTRPESDRPSEPSKPLGAPCGMRHPSPPSGPWLPGAVRPRGGGPCPPPNAKSCGLRGAEGCKGSFKRLDRCMLVANKYYATESSRYGKLSPFQEKGLRLRCRRNFWTHKAATSAQFHAARNVSKVVQGGLALLARLSSCQSMSTFFHNVENAVLLTPEIWGLQPSLSAASISAPEATMRSTSSISPERAARCSADWPRMI